jgi:hypothetical protein
VIAINFVVQVHNNQLKITCAQKRYRSFKREAADIGHWLKGKSLMPGE